MRSARSDGEVGQVWQFSACNWIVCEPVLCASRATQARAYVQVIRGTRRKYRSEQLWEPTTNGMIVGAAKELTSPVRETLLSRKWSCREDASHHAKYVRIQMMIVELTR